MKGAEAASLIPSRSPVPFPGNPKGIVSWTDAQVKSAIRTGHRPDGTPLVGPMAFAWYQNIGDADLDALVAYLRSLNPVKMN